LEACTASLPPEAVAQREAAVAAVEPVAQREAVVAAVEPVAQQQAAAESVAQQQEAAMQWGVRPLVFAATTVGPQRAASCSPMAPMARQILAAAVRFWFLVTPSLVRPPE
jgi:hypothetical protein